MFEDNSGNVFTWQNAGPLALGAVCIRGHAFSLASCVAFAVLNVWTFRHAWAMTHFSSGGASTIRPEEMSVWGRAQVLVTGINLPRPVNEKTPADLKLPFESHRVTTADGTELEAWHVPHADPRAMVVMFHGYGATKAEAPE